MARPSKYADDVIRVVVAALSTGASRDEAARKAGISARTLRLWCVRDEVFFSIVAAAEVDGRKHLYAERRRLAESFRTPAAA